MIDLIKIGALIALMLVLGSCQSEDTKDSNIYSEISSLSDKSDLYDFNVSVVDGRLSFDTREDYDKAIEFLGDKNTEGFINWETNLGFNSMRSFSTALERSKIGIHDDLLATLINKDAIIEIGGNVFKLDALKETVSVISSVNYKTSGITGKNTSEFSTSDNILDILEGKDVALSASARARYCSKRKLSWNYRYSNGTNKIHAKVVYQKAGFLNSLQSIIEEEKDLSGTPSSWNMTLQTNGTNNFWANKKRASLIPDKAPPIFNAARKNYRPYYSSRRLKKYRFSMKFSAQLKTGGSLRTKVITIDCL